MKGSRQKNTASLAMILATLALGLSACNGNRLTVKKNATSSLVTGGSSSSFAIRLNAVVPQASNPSANFSLSGDSSIGEYCYAVGGTPGISGSGVSTCECSYDFTIGSNSEQRRTNTLSYSNNEIICPYNAIPTQATQVAVKIIADQAGATSNAITINLQGTGSNLFLDLTNPESFRKVEIYQARKLHQDILHSYCDDTTKCPIDPFNSENYLLSFPVTFYSTNLGSALLNYGTITGNNPDQDPTYWKLGYSKDQAKTSFWQYHRIYSKAPTTQGANGSQEGYVMYDLYNTNRKINTRIDFQLARGQSGVFQYRIALPDAPASLTVLGYAAAPVTDAFGRINCPEESGNIPSNKHWVLIKPFASNTSFDSRYAWRPAYLESGIIHNKVACSPGVVSGSSNPTQPETYLSCDPSRNLDTALSSGYEKTGSQLTTKRAFYISGAKSSNPAACFAVSPGATSSTGSGFPSMNNIDALFADPNNATSGFAATLDPWGLDPNANVSSSQTGQEIQVNASIVEKSTSHGAGGYAGATKDYIMVAYPTGLTNAEYESRKDEFTPIRYKNKLACDVSCLTSNDSCNPEIQCANRAAAIIRYNPTTEDLLNNQVPDYYPLCAVQENAL